MKYIDYNENDIQEFEYETTMISDGSIVGACELGKATIKLLNDSNEYSVFKGSWIKTVHGSFYIYDVKPVQEKINIELTCYDIKYKLDTLYESKKYTFPLTLKKWRNSIFDNCGVKYDDSDFPNSNLILEKEPYIENGASNRTVIKMIAQAGASSVITDKNDIFYFSWFTDNVFLVDDWLELTTEKVKTDSINTVVLGRGDTEDNVYYPEQTQNPIEFRIDNNYILDPQDTDSDTDIRYKTIKPIYNRINGFSYLIFDIRTQQIDNKLSLTLGDKIKYYDIYDNELEAYVMTKKITYLGGDLSDDTNYEMTLSAEKVNETSTDLSYSSKIENKILSVERKADKQAGVILDEVKKIDSTLNSITTTNKTVSNKNSLYIEDALEENALEFRVKGKCEQATSTQGKNYFTGNKLASGTNVGITYDFDNSIIKLNGTTTGNNVIYTGTTKIKVPAGTYNYSLGLKSGSFIRNGNDLAIYLMSSYTEFITGSYSTSGRTLSDIENNSANRTNINFTTTKDAELYIRIFVNGSGLVCNNLELEVQLEPGKTMTAFEQFVPDSPSPDYPSEINTIKGIENLLPNNLTQGSWYGDVSDRVANYSNIWLEPGTYTFLTNIDTTKFNVWLGTCKAKSPQAEWSNINQIKNWTAIKEVTFTITTGGYFLNMFSKKDGTNITPDELSDLQQHLVNGPIPPDIYVPHGNWLAERITGQNFFNYIDNLNVSINGLTSTLNKDGSITTVGVPTQNYVAIVKRCDITDLLLDGEAYTIWQEQGLKILKIIIGAQTQSGSYIYYTGDTGKTTFTVNKEKYTYSVWVQTDTVANWGTSSRTITNKYMLCKGNGTNFKPYKEQNVLINLNKENLLDLSLLSGTQNGITYSYDKGLKISGTCTSDRITLGIPSLSLKGIYNFNHDLGRSIALKNSSGTNILITDKNVTNNANDTVTQMVIYLVNGATYNTIIDLKLYEGYSPYHELCSNKDLSVRDELVVNETETFIEKRIGKVILDGSEEWYKAEHGYYIENKANSPFANNSSPFGYCDKFKFQNDYKTWTELNYCGFNSVNTFWIRDDFAIATTVEEFKAWLKANPVTIYYELATPEKISLDKVDIPLYENINNLTLLEDLETDTSVKYLLKTPISEDYITRHEANAKIEITKDSITQLANETETNLNSVNQKYAETKLASDGLSISVADIQKNVNSQQEDISNINSNVNKTNSELNNLKNNINSTNEVVTKMNYSFGTKELTINKETDPVNTGISNKGMIVRNYTTIKTVANDKGLGTDDLIVTNTAQIGYLKFMKSTDENGKLVTDIHHLVSNIQQVSDLVGD